MDITLPWASFTPGTWYHVAVTFGSGQLKFYVNGTLQGSPVTVVGTLTTSNDPLTIGFAGGSYGYSFAGSLDDACVYNRALSQSEIGGLAFQAGTGVTTRYTLGTSVIGQERKPSGTTTWVSSYYGCDGLGSVRVLYDGSSTPTDTYTYDAFGRLQSISGTTVNNIRFAGQQWDPDLNLYYNRARYLNPDSGRFTSRDTFDDGPGDTSNLHRYLYCHSDPLNRFDPSGNNDFSLGSLMASTSMRFGLAGATYGAYSSARRGQNVFLGAASGFLFGAMGGAVPGAAWATWQGITALSAFSNFSIMQAESDFSAGNYDLATLEAVFAFAPLVIPAIDQIQAGRNLNVPAVPAAKMTPAERLNIFF